MIAGRGHAPFAAFIVLAGVGCGGGPSTATLNAADVSNIPAGTAVGTGGQPTGYSYQADDTVTGSGSGLSFDCDLHGSFSAAYQGP